MQILNYLKNWVSRPLYPPILPTLLFLTVGLFSTNLSAQIAQCNKGIALPLYQKTVIPIGSNIDLCQENMSGVDTDFSFNMVQVVNLDSVRANMPGDYFLRYNITGGTVVDMNTSSANVSTGTLISSQDGMLNTDFAPTYSDTIGIGNPMNLVIPVMVSYRLQVYLMTLDSMGRPKAVCEYNHPFKVTINPTPEITASASIGGAAISGNACAQQPIELQTNVNSGSTNNNSFSWSIINSDAGFGGNFDNRFAQNPIFTPTIDNSVVANGQMGMVALEVAINDSTGCVATDTLEIPLIRGIGALSCNDQINIALDDDCDTEVLPDQVLEGSFGTYDMFDVIVFDGGTNIGNTVGASHLNKKLTVRVVDQCSGNYCWGYLTVEDKLAPVIDCTINSYKTNAASGHVGVGDDRYQPTMAFPQGTTPSSCMLSGAATNAYYETLEFTTTAFGAYSFELVNATAGTNFDAAIYTGSFDPSNPCTNLLAADEASSSIANNPKLDVTLPVGTYVLVTYGHTNTDMGNYLWEITSPVDVNGAPQSICTMTDTITISCTIDINTIPGPSAIDNCEGSVTPKLLNFTSDNFSCGRADGTVEIITRTYQAEDSHGNTSGTCTQVIKYVRKTLNSVTFPPNYDGMTLPALDCSQPMTDAIPDSLGFPKIDGGSVLQGNACMLNVGHEDHVLTTCGIGKKILRKWTVMDWCSPLVTGVNPIEHTQVILFEDTTPPQITCPADLVVSAANSNCTATVDFPPLSISDDCSGFIVNINTLFGSINDNGGTISGFPIGVYDIKYIARDSCGNDTDCTTELKVVDETEPVPVCVEFLTTSLTSTGTATVPATSFDAGSYDNCCLDRFEVKRSNRPDGDFEPSITFDCDDLTFPINVDIRVYDCFDNFNDCNVEVRVDDKISATLTCPPNITITCTDDINDLTLTGNATVANGCSSSNITPTDRDLRDRCGIGRVVRSFEITTTGGIRRCTQVIDVTNSNPFDPRTITWPRDTTFMDDCGRGLDVDSLTSLYSYPTFSRNFCADLFVGHEDEYFERVEGACFKLFRNWKIIDWCVYNPDVANSDGIWTHRQELVVMDSQGPTMTCVRNIVVDADANCLGTVVIDEPTSVTDCSPDITFEVTGDFDDFGTFNDVAPGNYDVTIIASDGCGNSSSCDVPIIVRDVKAPTAICHNLKVELNRTWATATIKARMIDKGNIDNCGGPVRLSFSVDIDDTCKIFTCVDTGINMVNLYVWDEFNNNDFCIAEVEVQDNFDACQSPINRPSIAGSIKNEDDEPIKNIEISLNDANMAPAMTDADGQFVFEGLQNGNDYSVYPFCNDDFRNGVSTFDIIQISKHVLNEAPLTSPYKLIAADANKSGTITTLDIVALQKLVLHRTDDLPNNTSWRFVHKNYVFPIHTNPWYETFPELYSVNDITGAEQVDFVGIKIGDLNGDADMSNIGTVEDRTFEKHLTFNISNLSFEGGEQVQIDFTAENFENLMGYQTTIQFDETVLELMEVIPGVMTGDENFGKTFVENGILNTSWHSAAARSIGNEEVLFSLVFKTMKAGETTSEIWMDGSVTQSEAYLQNGEMIGVQLNTTEEFASIQLFQNEPNPFSNRTMIRFYLPKAAEAELVITDVSGKVVQTITKKYDAGMNQEMLDKSDLLQQGIYYYRLQTTEFVGVKKMLLIE